MTQDEMEDELYDLKEELLDELRDAISQDDESAIADLCVAYGIDDDRIDRVRELVKEVYGHGTGDGSAEVTE